MKMKNFLRNTLLLVLMVVASGLAMALRPTERIADLGQKVDLEAMIPRAFGEWQEMQQQALQIVDPQQQEAVDKIYNQVLTRTYVDRNGYRVMLSIAYGSDQSDAMQVHSPEACYPSQGFTLHERSKGMIDVGDTHIPVRRIRTSLGSRLEPVTYWTTVGGQVIDGGFSKKIIEMGYGLSGKIPDGMLIRVSSIDPDPKRAYAMQSVFSNQMLQALSSESRQRLSGSKPLSNR